MVKLHLAVLQAAPNKSQAAICRHLFEISATSLRVASILRARAILIKDCSEDQQLADTEDIGVNPMKRAPLDAWSQIIGQRAPASLDVPGCEHERRAEFYQLGNAKSRCYRYSAGNHRITFRLY